MRKILLAALGAVLVATPVAADQILGPSRIDNSSRVLLPGGPTLGLWAGGKYTATPDAIQIKGGGSTGDVSGMTVAPNASAAANTLANHIASKAPLASPTFSGNVGMLGALNIEPGAGNGVLRLRPKNFYSSFGGDGAQLESSTVIATDAVTAGSPVWSAIRSSVQIATGTNAFVWPILATVDYNADTPGTGQHVAITGKAIRRKFAPGGTGSNPELWGLLGSVESTTGQPSNIEGGGLALELDWSADGADPGKIRNGAVLAGTRRGLAAGPAALGSGYVVTSGDAQGGYGPSNVYWASGFVAAGAYKESAFDTRQATMMAGANAAWLADGHAVAWNTAGSFQTLFNTTTGRVETRFNSGVAQSVDGAGVIRTNRVVTAQANTNWGTFTVANLPTAAAYPELKDGDTAYASNGRKLPQTTAGSGTGVPVYYQGTLWHRYSDDATVQQ